MAVIFLPSSSNTLPQWHRSHMCNSLSLKVWRWRRRRGWMHTLSDIFFPPFSTCVWFEVSVKWKWSVTALLLPSLTEWQANWLAAELPTWLQAGWLSGSCSSQRWWTVFRDKNLAALGVQHRAIWQICLMKETDVSQVSVPCLSLHPSL